MSLFRDNPVFQRESRTRLRYAQRSLKNQQTLAGVLVALIIICYVSVYRSCVRYRISGSEIWLAACWTELVLGLVLMPAVCATAISVERQQGTLDLLLVTPLTTSEIVLSKYAARLLLAGVVAAAAAPWQVVALVRGGVPVVLAGWSMAFVVVSLTGAAALALLCSSTARLTASAVARAYTVVCLWLAAPLACPTLAVVFNMLSPDGYPCLPEEVLQAVLAVSPVIALAELPGLLRLRGQAADFEVFVLGAATGVLIGTVLTVGSLWLSARLLRREG